MERSVGTCVGRGSRTERDLFACSWPRGCYVLTIKPYAQAKFVHDFKPSCTCGLGVSIGPTFLCKKTRSGIEYLEQGNAYVTTGLTPYQKARSIALEQLARLPLDQVEQYAADSILHPALHAD